MILEDFPIEPLTPVLVRDELNTWWPAIFKGIAADKKYPFETYQGTYEMLTTLTVKEKDIINTQEDVFELWDIERLEKETDLWG